jgi:hypothetical protein
MVNTVTKSNSIFKKFEVTIDGISYLWFFYFNGVAVLEIFFVALPVAISMNSEGNGEAENDTHKNNGEDGDKIKFHFSIF